MRENLSKDHGNMPRGDQQLSLIFDDSLSNTFLPRYLQFFIISGRHLIFYFLFISFKLEYNFLVPNNKLVIKKKKKKLAYYYFKIFHVIPLKCMWCHLYTYVTNTLCTWRSNLFQWLSKFFLLTQSYYIL